MADRSAHFTESLQFHPCDTPRGMDNYDFNCLTKTQQLRLNNHKIEVVRENEKFLYKNPEIRAVLQIIMRQILLERPSHDIEEFIGAYFTNNWQSIMEEVRKYVEALPGKPSPGESKIQLKEDKHVTLDDNLSDDNSSLSSKSSDDYLTSHIIKDILDEILDQVHEQDMYVQHPKKVRTSVTEEVEVKHRPSEKSDDDDDELIFDLGLDFDLDFSGYHEEDDTNLLQSLSDAGPGTTIPPKLQI